MARFPPLAGLRRGLLLHLADELGAVDHRQSRAALPRRLRDARLQPRLPPQSAKRRRRRGNVDRQIFLQVAFDLVALTLLLYFADLPRNPFLSTSCST